MKRIFKKALFLFWCCALGFIFFGYISAVAEEDSEDIEWMDEEDEEIEDLQPEDAGETAQSDEEEPSSKKTESPKADIEDAEELDFMTDKKEGEGDSGTATAEESADQEAGDSLSTGSFADSYEQSLYETYIQHYSKRVSAEEWSNIAGNKDIYVIQSGDTLWDISKVLFGDPNYWPKLWSSNPVITNPHLIQPQGNLGFIHGTEGYPPSLNLVEGMTGKGAPKPPSFLKGVKVNVPSTSKTMPVIQNIST